MILGHSTSKSRESFFEVYVQLLLQSGLLCNFLGQLLSLLRMRPLLSLSLLLKLSPSLLLCVEFRCKFLLPQLERGFGPSPECRATRASLPVEERFAEESPFLVFLVDDIVPLVEAAANLLCVHSHDEVTHDAMGLLLHLGNQVLLLALILLNSYFEVGDLLLVLILPPVELFDVIEVQSLPLDTAHLFPNAESFVHELLVDRIGASGQELLCQLVSPYV